MIFENIIQYFFNELRVPQHRRENKLRIPRKLARQFLLENSHIITEGKFRWFSLKHIGEGIFEIKLREIGERDTILEKK